MGPRIERNKGGLKTEYEKFLNQIAGASDPAGRRWFYMRHGNSNKAVYTTWWGRWAGDYSVQKRANIHADFVQNIRRLPHIVAFFRQFTADAYAISGATLVHRHPDPVTVVGIAIPVQEQKRRATLFVTSGESLRHEELAVIVNNLLGGPSVLFSETFLSVRYLKADRNYLMISGMDSTVAPTGELRDLGDSTEAYVFANAANTAANRQRIFLDLEAQFRAGPVRDLYALSSTNRYTISTWFGTVSRYQQCRHAIRNP